MKPIRPIQNIACELDVLGGLVGHWPEHAVFNVENRRARKRDEDGPVGRDDELRDTDSDT